MNSPNSSDDRYDLILIGSGIGALTIASLMAQLRGKRILVLERHFKAGGFTHTFKRQQFHWDVGLHYVGQMGEGSPLRNLFDLITGKNVQWAKMPDPFEKFLYPDFTFDLHSGEKRQIVDLIAQFPQEERGIRQYFRDISKASSAYFWHVMRQNGTLLFKAIAYLQQLWNRFDLNLTTKDYLDRHFKSEPLKALLASQWGDYGLPPGKSLFAMHAIIVNHFLEGGYYPVGGAGGIAKGVGTIVKKSGGQFLLNREVTEILIENDRAVGVKARKVNAKDEAIETYHAPVIISDAGAANTYLKLVPPDYPLPFRQSLHHFIKQYPPTSNITLYLGLSDPRPLGFQGSNYWIYNSLDHDTTYERRKEGIEQVNPPQAWISFPSLKDPQTETHTAEILAWANYDSFTRWREQPWRDRDEDYQALKQRLSEALIGIIEQHYPGFSQLVEYQELSTPLTNELFANHVKGGIYGLPFVRDRIQSENSAWTRAQTPIPGLYLTGADVFSPGVVGAMMGGIVTLTNLPDGISLPQAFTAAARQK
jgi:phytoene dehydrogenase-like protein